MDDYFHFLILWGIILFVVFHLFQGFLLMIKGEEYENSRLYMPNLIYTGAKWLLK